MRGRIKTVDEAKDLIENWNGRVYAERSRNYIRIESDKGVYRLPFDEALYNELKSFEKIVRGKIAEEEKPESPPQPPSKLMKKGRTLIDLDVWNTWIAKRRPLIEDLIQRIGWFQSAVQEIGSNVILFALLTSSPTAVDELPDTLRKIKDRDEFVSFVMDKLVTMYVASRDRDVVEKLREENIKLRVLNAFLEQQYSQLKYRFFDIVSRLRKNLEIALSVMPDYALKRYAKVVTLTTIGEKITSAIPVSVEEKPVKGEISE